MDDAQTTQQRVDTILTRPHELTLMFQKFAHSEATGSILLLIATVGGYLVLRLLLPNEGAEPLPAAH